MLGVQTVGRGAADGPGDCLCWVHSSTAVRLKVYGAVVCVSGPLVFPLTTCSGSQCDSSKCQKPNKDVMTQISDVTHQTTVCSFTRKLSYIITNRTVTGAPQPCFQVYRVYVVQLHVKHYSLDRVRPQEL